MAVRGTATSVICPCRDERGTIRDLVRRMPVLGDRTELVFVDGGSTDGTVAEIEAVRRENTGPLEIRLLHQGTGTGKGDAVRLGFSAARHPLLMILDADLSVAPEELPLFHAALTSGKGDLVNGVRLAGPMETGAMRPLNLAGNKLFARTLSWVLSQPIKDALCGTKALRRADYDRIEGARAFFGDFDPFGDFDLLFGAARLGLRILDLPVRYRARVYGDTKIHRFRDGLRLARMTALGAWKLRLAPA